MNKRHHKEAGKKEALRMIEGQYKNGQDSIDAFMTEQADDLRLAQIVKYEGDKRYKLKFSQEGKQMLGEYRPKRSRSLSKKGKAASRKLNRNVLPGENSFVIVKWDAEQAANNEARGQEGQANIVAVLPKNPALEEKAMKVANHAAKKAGKAKPWPLDELFEREESRSNEEEEEEEEEKPKQKSRRSNSKNENE